MGLGHLLFALSAGRYTTYENMFMYFSMAFLAKCYSVVYVISEFFMSCKWLYVMGVQHNSVTIAAMVSTFLAGVIIALKYLLAPFFIFGSIAGESIFVSFINMVFPLGLICFFSLFSSCWVCNFGASKRTELSEHSTLSILWHRFSADGALDFNIQAVWAKLIERINILTALLAYLTGLADAARISLIARSAGDTSCIFGWLTHHGYRWSKYTTISTWFHIGLIARFTDAVFAAVRLTDKTPILCHTTIISQLPELAKVKL